MNIEHFSLINSRADFESKIVNTRDQVRQESKIEPPEYYMVPSAGIRDRTDLRYRINEIRRRNRQVDSQSRRNISVRVNGQTLDERPVDISVEGQARRRAEKQRLKRVRRRIERQIYRHIQRRDQQRADRNAEKPVQRRNQPRDETGCTESILEGRDEKKGEKQS